MSTPTWKKHLILFFGFLENLIFSGNILGWSALNYMLKQEGIYEYVCDSQPMYAPIIGNQSYLLSDDDFRRIENDTIETAEVVHRNHFIRIDASNRIVNPLVFSMENNSSNVTFTDEINAFHETPVIDKLTQHSLGCIQQDKLLNLAYTIGSFCMGFTAFIWGFLLDKWGLRIVRLLINMLITGGVILLCFTNRDRSYLIFPAITLMSVAGIPLRIANMQFANLFPQKRSTVITFYSGAFSASAIVFVALKYLYDFGSSFFVVSLLLVIASLMMLPFTFLLLPSDRVEEEGTNESRVDLFRNKVTRNTGLVNISPVTLEKFTVITSPNMLRKMDLNSNGGPIDDRKQAYAITGAESETSLSLQHKPEIPLSISLWSWSFILLEWWYSWLITYMVMYVGSLNLWLNRVTTDLTVAGNIAKIYGVVQVLALVLAPIAGLIMDYIINDANKETDPFIRKLRRAKAGFWPKLFTTLFLAAIIICHFFDNYLAVYISIIFITLMRSFIIAVASAFLRIRFHGEHFNRLLGIMSTTGAVITLVQFPLFVWEAQSQANAVWVNIFNTVCTILAFLSPLHLIITPLQKYLIRKEESQETKAKFNTKK